MKLYRRTALSLLLAALAALAPPAAQAAPTAKDELAPTGTLRVAVAISNLGGPFWSAVGPDGSVTGVPVDLGRALAQRLGVPVTFVKYENSGQITDAAASGAWDVTFVPEDAARAQKMAFGPIYNSADATFLVRPGSTAQSFADLDNPAVKVVAVANTTTLRGAQRALAHNTVVGVQKVDDIVAGMRAGTIDAFANLRDQLVPLSAQLPGSRVLPGAFQQTKTAVAVPLDHPAALAYVSAFLAQAKTDGTLRRLFDAHGLQAIAIAP
ncbi:MAG TPA: transporter substrate-binding domain-containing protein [Candidatus Sulfotelmatobacter sp.]|nr:transporter substrate-binding domain-containing protein [Candidatus Sulfotelmatobacter sp.]